MRWLWFSAVVIWLVAMGLFTAFTGLMLLGLAPLLLVCDLWDDCFGLWDRYYFGHTVDTYDYLRRLLREER